jgi:hypothetical protein
MKEIALFKGGFKKWLRWHQPQDWPRKLKINYMKETAGSLIEIKDIFLNVVYMTHTKDLVQVKEINEKHPPEMFREEDAISVLHAVDIYAVAVILWQLW